MYTNYFTNYFLITFILAALALFTTADETELPQLIFSGFSWAENLAFDGLGNMFVSENTRGEVWRIFLNSNQSDYDGVIHLSDGLKKVGGVQISPDGKTLYAGVTFSDDSTGVITASTAEPINGEMQQSYSVLTTTRMQPNGMAVDWTNNVLYYTFEGSNKEPGMLMSVDIASLVESDVHEVEWADGLWLDETTNLLYAGQLQSMKISVFEVTPTGAKLTDEYTGLSDAFDRKDRKHMLDDITVFSTDIKEMGSTVMLGGDWLGQALRKFSLDGKTTEMIPPPEGIEFNQVTSVRWGKGPGFDPNSVYITEGGGMLAAQKDRRVIQIRMK